MVANETSLGAMLVASMSFEAHKTGHVATHPLSLVLLVLLLLYNNINMCFPAIKTTLDDTRCLWA